MTGLDTCVLVRYFMQDDVAQSRVATRLLESLTTESPGFIADVTVVELVWVLESSYDLTREQVADLLGRLLAVREIRVDRSELVAQAVRTYRTGGADLADALIARIGLQAGCGSIATFDLRAIRDAGMSRAD